MKKVIDGVMYDLTDEEIVINRKYEVQEKHRPLTESEVNAMLIKAQVNTVEIDDQISVRMKDYYPTWTECIGKEVNQGFKFTYQGKLYKVLQSHTMQENYIPGTGTESLYSRIDEEHDGDLYDPIPYEGNMELYLDKFYTQNGILYICTRSTGTPVYNALADLIDIYVEVVESN